MCIFSKVEKNRLITQITQFRLMVRTVYGSELLQIWKKYGYFNILYRWNLMSLSDEMKLWICELEIYKLSRLSKHSLIQNHLTGKVFYFQNSIKPPLTLQYQSEKWDAVERVLEKAMYITSSWSFCKSLISYSLRLFSHLLCGGY